LARGGVESLVEKRIWLRILIVIRGMPPFPGFFLKFNILTFLVSTGQPGLVAVFLIGTAGFVYVYVTFFI